MLATGVLAADTDMQELGEITGKVTGTGARLVYLDLQGCSFVDSRIVSPIVRINKELQTAGCRFELRISDDRLRGFFKEIELDRIVAIRESKPCSESETVSGPTLAS
ncbi:MAG: hypothetical protein GF418_08430 [Chitinivibrionales bacterium]|nr:hypothetical protein [Chitinivibrionales bacterium]MBD3395639.1 hypothetical protein [Chitinivibrionales bacterium]